MTLPHVVACSAGSATIWIYHETLFVRFSSLYGWGFFPSLPHLKKVLEIVSFGLKTCVSTNKDVHCIRFLLVTLKILYPECFCLSLFASLFIFLIVISVAVISTYVII